MPPRNPQRGLTMLEMLVVLMLVALLGTLVVQGLAFFVRSYDAVTARPPDDDPRGLAPALVRHRGSAASCPTASKRARSPATRRRSSP